MSLWYMNGWLSADQGSGFFWFTIFKHCNGVSCSLYKIWFFFKVCTENDIKLICMLKLDVFYLGWFSDQNKFHYGQRLNCSIKFLLWSNHTGGFFPFIYIWMLLSSKGKGMITLLNKASSFPIFLFLGILFCL